ncbi:MAG: hypothetical protein AAFZ15_27620 [Bacteroidota bacterium]
MDTSVIRFFLRVLAAPAFYAFAGYFFNRFFGVNLPLIDCALAFLGGLYWLVLINSIFFRELNKFKKNKSDFNVVRIFGLPIISAIIIIGLVYIKFDCAIQGKKNCCQEVEILKDSLEKQNKIILNLQDSIAIKNDIIDIQKKSIIYLDNRINDLEYQLKKCCNDEPPIPTPPCDDYTEGNLNYNGDKAGFILTHEGKVLAETDNFGAYIFKHCEKGIKKSCGETILVKFTKGKVQFQSRIYLCVTNQS